MLKPRSIYAIVGLMLLLAGGVMISTLAMATEVEAPFWKVSEKRLGLGEKRQAKLKERKTAKEEQMIVKSELPIEKGELRAPVELRCKAAVSKNAELKGSKEHEDAYFNVGLSLSGCKLWAKNGKELVEEKACVVEVSAGEELAGRFWFEGTALEAKTNMVLLFKAAKMAVFKITGLGCKFNGEYTLGGSVAVQLNPERAEGKAVKFILPAPAITDVHQAQPTEEKVTTELTLGTNKALLSGELSTELETGTKFGAFAPEGEAPFWKVNETRLGLGESLAAKVVGLNTLKELKETVVKAEMPIEEGKTTASIELRCGTVASETAELIGSKEKEDGSFGVGLSMKGCKLWAKNGKELVEEKACVVEVGAGEKLAGRFWLEGTTLENKPEIVLLLKASKLATFKITGVGCRFVGAPALSGSVAVRVSPENTESKTIAFIFPAPPITIVHQAQLTKEEAKVGLTLGSSKAIVVSEMEAEVEGGAIFGAFE